jgi:acetyl esterase/lipase
MHHKFFNKFNHRRLSLLLSCICSLSLFGEEKNDSYSIISNLDYANTGNPRQTLDLYFPKKNADDKHTIDPLKKLLPLIIWVHGGGWQNGSKISGRNPARLPHILKTGRYIGASINYRLSNESTWPAQIYDCKAAIRWLAGNASKYRINENKIAVWGSSAGGHLASMLGNTNGDKELEGEVGIFLKSKSNVHAVINYYGPSAFLKMDHYPSTIKHNNENSPESRLLGQAIQKIPNIAKQASPLFHVKRQSTPFIHFHGRLDPLVPYQQSLTLHKKMLLHGNNSCLISVRGGTHYMPGNFTLKFVIPFLDYFFYGLGNEIESQEVTLNK